MYTPFSIWIVNTPEKLKEFNVIFARLHEDEQYRNDIRLAIDTNQELKTYEYAALQCYDRIEGAERRFEENKAKWAAKEQQNGNAE